MGRLASRVANLLRGKGKPVFSPHMDVGDYVVVVNAAKVRLTGSKPKLKTYFRHSNYPGGSKVTGFKDMMKKKPCFAVEHAIRGMISKTTLGRKIFSKLHVYAGPGHPHQAQKPVKIEV